MFDKINEMYDRKREIELGGETKELKSSMKKAS